MSQTVLVANTGRGTGSPAARRLRAEGHIPAVLYGHGMAPLSVTVERRSLRIALSGAAGSNTVLELQVDGKSYPAVIKEMQRHPVKRTVSHIDFLQVSMNESITVSVPLRLEGEAKAVVAANGLVDPAVDSVEVVTTPANMPNEFVVDITEMQPGDVIRLGDLKMPAGASAVGDPEMPIVTVLSLRAEEAVATADAEAAEEAADDAADDAAADAAGEGSEPGAATDSDG